MHFVFVIKFVSQLWEISLEIHQLFTRKYCEIHQSTVGKNSKILQFVAKYAQFVNQFQNEKTLRLSPLCRGRKSRNLSVNHWRKKKRELNSSVSHKEKLQKLSIGRRKIFQNSTVEKGLNKLVQKFFLNRLGAVVLF